MFYTNRAMQFFYENNPKAYYIDKCFLESVLNESVDSITREINSLMSNDNITDDDVKKIYNNILILEDEKTQHRLLTKLALNVTRKASSSFEKNTPGDTGRSVNVDLPNNKNFKIDMVSVTTGIFDAIMSKIIWYLEKKTDKKNIDVIYDEIQEVEAKARLKLERYKKKKKDTVELEKFINICEKLKSERRKQSNSTIYAESVINEIKGLAIKDDIYKQNLEDVDNMFVKNLDDIEYIDGQLESMLSILNKVSKSNFIDSLDDLHDTEKETKKHCTDNSNDAATAHTMSQLKGKSAEINNYYFNGNKDNKKKLANKIEKYREKLITYKDKYSDNGEFANKYYDAYIKARKIDFDKADKAETYIDDIIKLFLDRVKIFINITNDVVRIIRIKN